MSTKRAGIFRRELGIGPIPLNPEDPAAASAALAATAALLRALRDRGLLSEGEIEDLFSEAEGHIRNASGAQNLLYRLRSWVEHKDEE